MANKNTKPDYKEKQQELKYLKLIINRLAVEDNKQSALQSLEFSRKKILYEPARSIIDSIYDLILVTDEIDFPVKLTDIYSRLGLLNINDKTKTFLIDTMDLDKSRQNYILEQETNKSEEIIDIGSGLFKQGNNYFKIKTDEGSRSQIYMYSIF